MRSVAYLGQHFVGDKSGQALVQPCGCNLRRYEHTRRRRESACSNSLCLGHGSPVAHSRCGVSAVARDDEAAEATDHPLARAADDQSLVIAPRRDAVWAGACVAAATPRWPTHGARAPTAGNAPVVATRAGGRRQSSSLRRKSGLNDLSRLSGHGRALYLHDTVDDLLMGVLIGTVRGARRDAMK